ncbi:MAG: hypothetical protein LAO77_10805 [Acidobacteriia bacterium]|nr:hypothetical protein [Terriglobia bacterium]
MTARFTRPRFVAFALLSVTLSLAISMAALLAVDVYAHSRVDKTSVNIWGYRGAVVGRKRPGEIRVVVAGGSTVLGYGLAPDEAFPQQLERVLNDSAENTTARFRVVNLGFNNEGAFSFQYTLADYAYLNYDVAVLYEGYNDLTVVNRHVFRREAALFRWFGYYPMLPTIAMEKMMLLRTGDLRAAYRGEKTVFQPTAVARTKAALLDASMRLYASMEHQAASWHRDAPLRITDIGCSERWTFYCSAVDAGIAAALARRSRVVVVTQPWLTDLHRAQQAELRRMLQARYGTDPRVSYLGLGDAIDLRDPELCWDGMHLTPRGNQIIARSLMPAVRGVATAALSAR